MKLRVLALDYDGTISTGDGIHPAVRDAIVAARTSGIVVLLVTGRRLDDLRRAMGDLHVVDGIVAENGAVVHFPASAHTTRLAPAIADQFTRALAQRGIGFAVGECLVDARAVDAPIILEVIRALELPLVLLFNRGQVMVLPQGISKSTGLRAALGILRQSPRNTTAVGDAENDHELLRVAEVGAAVEWGSQALRAAADTIVTGTGPPAVADFVHGLLVRGNLPPVPSYRRRLRLGYLEDGTEFTLSVRGRNVLVTGDPKSGKSWIGGLLVEQLILHGYAVCVLDPEGDYRSLEALPGVAILGGEDLPPTPRELARALRYPDQSVVVDLSRLPQDEKVPYIRATLPALNAIRRKNGFPHRVVLDEAHYFLHHAEAYTLLDLELNGYTLITFCASRLPRQLLAATDVILVTSESNPAEVDALFKRCATDVCGTAADWRARFGRLHPGQAIALPVTAESGGRLQLFTIGQRMTPHVRHREKYVDVPVADHRAFVFTHYAPYRRARTLREFVVGIEGTPRAALDGYLRRGDFSRWVREVFGDHGLADELRLHEERYAAGLDIDAVPEIAAAVRGRYDLLSLGDLMEVAPLSAV